MEVNNGLIICYGVTKHTGNAKATLPTAYTDKFCVVASINQWTANATYSIAVQQASVTQIQLDHWYNATTSLVGPCSYITVGY